MLDQQRDVGRVAPETRSSNDLYRRPLPGGGFVEVEMDAMPGPEGAPERYRGRVIVERRGDIGRRIGHEPPVVAELSGDDADELMTELFRLAQDNSSLARGLLRWQAARAHAD